MFLYRSIMDHGLWSFFSLVGYYLLYGFEKKGFAHKAGEVLGYLMGYYMLVGIIDTLTFFAHYDPYTLFIVTMFRISTIILVSIFMALAGNTDFKIQLIVALGCLIISGLGGVSGMLFYSRHLIGAWIIAGTVLAGAVSSLIVILNKN
ncbi:MAG: hypothetical protein JEY99_13420 [Spirochaetales bacterium]|nr:hypothetical protein [Spirochaetales bacterium]